MILNEHHFEIRALDPFNIVSVLNGFISFNPLSLSLS